MECHLRVAKRTYTCTFDEHSI